MKSIFALAAFSFSMSTFAACPDLTGNWRCQNSDSTTSAFQISQVDIPNGTQYDFTASGQTTAINADGIKRTYASAQGTATVFAECTSASTVHINISGVSADQTQSATEDFDVTSIDAGNMQTKGTLTQTINHQTTTKETSSRCFNVHE